MYISDSLFAKVNDPVTMGILFYLISVADDDGNVRMSYSDIGNALGYEKMKVMRCLRKLECLNAIVTLPLRSRYTKTVIKVCNIGCYKRGVTLQLHCSYTAVTVDGDKSQAKTTPKPKKKSIEERAKVFADNANMYLEQYGKSMISDFCSYWTESSKNGSKMRFEKERTFDIKLRLARWRKNEFNNPSPSSERKMHQDGTILHEGQMDVTKGGW